MKVLPFKNYANEKSSVIDHSPMLRAFNMGPVKESELSIWLESTFCAEATGARQITLTIKNEGKQAISNFWVRIKTNKGLKLLNPMEFLGLGGRQTRVQILSVKKSISWFGQFELDESENDAQIIAEIFTKTKTGHQIKLSAHLDMFRQISRLGA